jgi:hypothetical protein
MWNIQIFDQGVLLHEDLIITQFVQLLVSHYERQGYEVRAEQQVAS